MKVYLLRKGDLIFEVLEATRQTITTTTTELAKDESSFELDKTFFLPGTAARLRELNWTKFGPLGTEIQDDHGVGRVKFVKSISDYAIYLQNELNKHLPDPVIIPSVKGVKVLDKDELAPFRLKRIEGRSIEISDTQDMKAEFDEEYYNLMVKGPKEKSVRPLTKEEAKLRRQATEATETLRVTGELIEGVQNAVDNGRDFIYFNDTVTDEMKNAVKEVFPYVSVSNKINDEGRRTGQVSVEFVD